ncbi:quercetin 2,3-dioxygenase [Aspergillus terreus]|uniref:Quercetin 2,3-dioxygenase n=1 Tax=Aspergillus terreus TaxID=33178 RepID=A0A5M3Z7F4_ASPTE|nr:hypothetical protein ATETN484_0011008200 [Aspergillus terreus]GFF18719.1 quercetin 2,3-dioxygenase [Aspergillus terreus]
MAKYTTALDDQGLLCPLAKSSTRRSIPTGNPNTKSPPAAAFSDSSRWQRAAKKSTARRQLPDGEGTVYTGGSTSRTLSHRLGHVLPHYANPHAVTIGIQLYRFTVPGPSSDNVFTLMNTNAGATGSLGVLPHIHQAHHENFFTFRGDYGSVPRNTAHTFQMLDPDTDMVGALSPGQLEDLFHALGKNYTSDANTPYVLQAVNDSSAAGPRASEISSLGRFDIYAQVDFQPGEPGESSFIANNYGPKYPN